jgi:hypothetical protein
MISPRRKAVAESIALPLFTVWALAGFAGSRLTSKEDKDTDAINRRS